MTWTRLVLALIARSVAHPRLGVDLLRVAWRFRDRRWYARFPFLPLPSRDYLQWRMHTAYGSHDTVPPVEDVVRFAGWMGRKP